VFPGIDGVAEFGRQVAIPSSSENGSEFDRPKESGKFEELPRAVKRSNGCGSDGVRRLFENSTVCLIVNANYLTLVGVALLTVRLVGSCL